MSQPSTVPPSGSRPRSWAWAFAALSLAFALVAVAVQALPILGYGEHWRTSLVGYCAWFAALGTTLGVFLHDCARQEPSRRRGLRCVYLLSIALCILSVFFSGCGVRDLIRVNTEPLGGATRGIEIPRTPCVVPKGGGG